ncbi:hypothetical protein Sfulv_34750 [Streptomyces fulvorobeus]|uniref:Uncharacterized protein n=1 Tax=Streptomyces fulvorobeus TaxID=284028 RepID=A0A7J0C9V8_9ACTN|nr:hypothetical protein Sfulv_34750 [Streptomyces fulvorobeus]
MQGDQVEPVHGFRHGVFDLEAGVHLQEVRMASGRYEELDGARPQIADSPRGGGGGFVQPGPERVVESGRGGLLDHLLVAALERAVPGAEHPHGPVAVGHDLDLDVPAPFDVRLGEDLAVPERGGGLRRGGRQLAFQ